MEETNFKAWRIVILYTHAYCTSLIIINWLRMDNFTLHCYCIKRSGQSSLQNIGQFSVYPISLMSYCIFSRFHNVSFIMCICSKSCSLMDLMLVNQSEGMSLKDWILVLKACGWEDRWDSIAQYPFNLFEKQPHRLILSRNLRKVNHIPYYHLVSNRYTGFLSSHDFNFCLA